MSARGQSALRGTVRALQAAMMTQIILGLTRFFAPFLGWRLPETLWRIHPVLGVLIAVTVAILLRARRGETAATLRRAARVAPMAPLALGLAIAFGLPLGPPLVPLHMLLGVTALGIVDRALKHLLAQPAPAHERALTPQPRA